MNETSLTLTEMGLEVLDLQEDAQFKKRRRPARDVASQMQGMQRIAHAFVETPETILQELVNSAIDLCGADSAGISIELDDRCDESFYVWAATAGRYARFLNATLPRYPSACGVCLERGRPQLFRANQQFFDFMGMEAPVVTDGILLPWQVNDTRGTIWILAHERDEAFDGDDCRLMQVFADFAAMAVRNQRQQAALVKHAATAAAAAMANDLAHQINNPLQSLTNLAYLAAQGAHAGDTASLGHELTDHVRRLSLLVQGVLTTPANADTRSLR